MANRTGSASTRRRRRSPRNGEDQWPKPPLPGCLQPDAIAL